MAKRGKSSYTGTDDDDDKRPYGHAPRDLGRGDNDQTGEDSAEATDPNPPRERAAGEEGYIVVEPGTVIDGVYYPRADCAEGENPMTVYLSEDKAQALADGGVKLAKDGEIVAAQEKEEEEEIPDQSGEEDENDPNRAA